MLRGLSGSSSVESVLNLSLETNSVIQFEFKVCCWPRRGRAFSFHTRLVGDICSRRSSRSSEAEHTQTATGANRNTAIRQKSVCNCWHSQDYHPITSGPRRTNTLHTLPHRTAAGQQGKHTPLPCRLTKKATAACSASDFWASWLTDRLHPTSAGHVCFSSAAQKLFLLYNLDDCKVFSSESRTFMLHHLYRVTIGGRT